MICNLNISNKKMSPIKGSLSLSTSEIDNRCDAMFFVSNKCAYKLERPVVRQITQYVIILDGFECTGIDQKGNKKYIFVKWCCNFGEYITEVKP